MFGKKKEKKESSTSGGTSNYRETTTVQQSNNGTTVIRQISSESRQVRGFSREERSVSISHSNSAGNFPLLSTTSLTEQGSRLFGSSSTSGANFSAIQHDASPFTFSSSASRTPALPYSRTIGTGVVPRPNVNNPSTTFNAYRSGPSFNSGSYPMRSRQLVLPTIATQSAAQDPNIAQSVPARTDNIIPTYSHKGSKLGKALIINNIKFVEKKEERQGAKKDSDDLQKLLRTMDFEVEHKTDMKGKDMFKKVKDFSQSNFARHGIALVVIMSHGNNLVKDGDKISRVRGGFTQIAGIDNNVVLSDDIIEQFTAASCHQSLKGKPKIFIFQCCRGEKDLEVCHDASPIIKQKKEYADVLIAFSTLPGYLSNRDPKSGTWYIQSICEVFERHHKDYHVEELLKIVDDKLSNKHPQYTQTSTYESRGFKRCFLHKNSR